MSAPKSQLRESMDDLHHESPSKHDLSASSITSCSTLSGSSLTSDYNKSGKGLSLSQMIESHQPATLNLFGSPLSGGLTNSIVENLCNTEF